jgi:L-asparaginase II
MKVGEILLEVVRNDLVESVHAGHLLIVDSNGDSKLELGDLDSPIYPRSAIKSIQAAAMLRVGLQVTPQQLALVCASHAGSNDHLDIARAILSGAGLDPSALLNTPDRPLGAAERSAWGDQAATSLAANCSGKHAGMLATCVANGWDISSYKNPEHQLQQVIRDEFEALSGERIAKVAVDGCGAPLFALSIRAIARAIDNLIHSNDPVHREVVSACTSFPIMVSGIGRLPTILMEQVPGLFAKDGAEGVMVMAHRSLGTIIWKMSDGSQRGAGPLALATLSHLGLSAALEPEYVRGGGEVVGEIRASRIVANG